MKKIFFACAAIAGLLSFSGCSDDINFGEQDGEGRVLLSPVLKSDVAKARSRAALTDDELAGNAIVWISNSKGVVRKFQGIDNVPVEGVWLVADNYVAEVWAGDSVPASFDHKQFKGLERFSVSGGQTVQVQIECRIANTVVEVRYDDVVDQCLTDYAVTVGHSGAEGTLVFNGREDEGRPAYYMMPSSDKNLSWTLTGKKLDGSDYMRQGKIENVQPATKYVLTFTHNDDPTLGDFGGAFIDVVVDETEIEVADVIEIMAPPTLKGLNFDLNEVIKGESGRLDEKKLWLKSTSQLQSVEISCPTFFGELGIGGTEFELFGMQDNIRTQLEAKGFSWQHFTHVSDENPAYEEMKLVFSADFMNLIPNGEHAITIKATDRAGRTSVNVMNILLTDAKVVTVAVPSDAVSTWPTRATIYGTVMKEEATNIGFNYRQQGTQQWTTVLCEGATGTYSTELTDLVPGTTYEYQAICDGFVSDIKTVTTEAPLQLKNAGFEDWNTSDKAYLLCQSEADMFWDSGNHGSATMNKNVTTPDSEIKHSGNYSVKLSSQFVGLGMIGKFAAGNVFVGKYLDTNGTDGVLGWGREFTSRPKALKGYVKYTPGTVEYTSKDLPEVSKGDMDKGIIYIAIVDDSRMSYSKKTGPENWPCIVKTKASERHLFSRNDANVIAYGEKVFSEATQGDGMIEFEIPLEYVSNDVKAANIILVCSASKGGDFFVGGDSVMYLDDFELVY